MRNGTKLGLILIALTWLAASMAVSVHFIAKAQDEVGAHTKFTGPILYRVSADI